MNYILLMLVVAGVTMQQVVTKSYGAKVKGGTYSYSVGTMVFALLFFVLTSGGSCHFSFSIMGYSIAFAVATSVTIIFTLLSVYVVIIVFSHCTFADTGKYYVTVIF